MSVPAAGFMSHLHVPFSDSGDQSNSTRALMEHWLSAEHGALLTTRELTLRGVRAGGGDVEGMEKEVQAQVQEKGPTIGNFRHTQYDGILRWVPAYPYIRGAGMRLFLFNTHPV